MAWRLVRAWTPTQDPRITLKFASDPTIRLHSATQLSDSRWVLEALAPVESVEQIVTLLEESYGSYPDFQVVVQEIEAIVPTPAEPDRTEHEGPPMSMDEVLESAWQQAGKGGTYVAAVAVASVVAATGVLRNSTELVLGAMVIAPLLGPSVALSVATTLGRVDLLFRSLKSNVIGFFAALTPAIGMGLAFGIDLDAEHVLRRLQPSLFDFLVAGSAGIVGALALVKRSISSVVGVMIAVALLPPLVVTGMLIGAGHFYEALGPGLITFINFIGINVAGVLVFRVLEIKPRGARERKGARRAVWISTALWVSMLVVLAVIVALLIGPEFP